MPCPRCNGSVPGDAEEMARPPAYQCSCALYVERRYGPCGEHNVCWHIRHPVGGILDCAEGREAAEERMADMERSQAAYKILLSELYARDKRRGEVQR